MIALVLMELVDILKAFAAALSIVLSAQIVSDRPPRVQTQEKTHRVRFRAFGGFSAHFE
ncbi:hypothetical protein [Paenibacillus campi]|uniref:hypothetical protein n=1 Tax=Paenibacillus campi TaxID=3106031 RepID=UPI002B003A99|nr:hypothetical protein [Paenibacillus sp. SGZ-1009]